MSEDKDEIQIILPDDSEITENGIRILLERTVKHKGIWRIHKNDLDDLFPSDFHADRQDGPEKLDLYTGNVYSSTTNKLIYTLSKKSMKYFQKELLKSKEDTIKDKANKII